MQQTSEHFGLMDEGVENDDVSGDNSTVECHERSCRRLRFTHEAFSLHKLQHVYQLKRATLGAGLIPNGKPKSTSYTVESILNTTSTNNTMTTSNTSVSANGRPSRIDHIASKLIQQKQQKQQQQQQMFSVDPALAASVQPFAHLLMSQFLPNQAWNALNCN